MVKTKPKPVLVIDDYSLARQMLVDPLAELGLTEVLEAADGCEGMNIIQQQHKKGNPVCMVICDVNMPKLGGMELLKLLRTNDTFKELPFVFLTVEYGNTSIEQAFEAGASGYMTKPFTRSAIVRSLTPIVKKFGINK